MNRMGIGTERGSGDGTWKTEPEQALGLEKKTAGAW
jgi:hypothetical protein